MTDSNNIFDRAKAYLSTTDLATNGGLLNPMRSDRLIRRMTEETTLLSQIRVVPMNAPTMKIDKINIGDRVLHGAVTTGDRLLSATKYVVPVTSHVDLATKEAMAVVELPDDVLEDNIERQVLQDTVLEMLAVESGKDLETAVLYADTSTSSAVDDFLCLWDGVFKLATDHVVDAANTQFNKRIVNRAVKSLPKRYLRDKSSYKMYIPSDKEADYRILRSDRQTPIGDTAETSWQPLTVVGFPLAPVYTMTTNQGIFTNPKNIILGIQRRFNLEMQRNALARSTYFVLTLRADIQIEETDAIVTVSNLGDDASLI